MFNIYSFVKQNPLSYDPINYELKRIFLALESVIAIKFIKGGKHGINYAVKEEYFCS